MKPMIWIPITVVVVAVASAVFFQLSCRLSGPTEWVEVDGADGAAPTEASVPAPSFYDLQTRTLEGDPVGFEEQRGQVALVVNVASRCGLTKQYAALQALHDEFSPRGFTVLGFPSNDFLNQEPGDAEEIREFCTLNFGVTFPLYEKRVVSGDDKDQVFQFLTRDLEEPTWNFTKYLVDREGRVLARFAPKTTPTDPELRAAIEAALGA